ncbi:MAG: hypothetical protein ACP5KN_19540, partial [Armatimonadota bacterium]
MCVQPEESLMQPTLTTGKYEHRRSARLAGDEAPPGSSVTRIEVDPSGRAAVWTDEGTFAHDDGKWESTAPPGPRPAAELPQPWRGYCREGQAVELARFGDEAAVVWFHNELHLVGRDGFSEVMLKDCPAPLRQFHCGSVGPDGTLWLGGRQGAVCLRHGRWEYYAGPRYLPADEVIDLAAGPEGSAWIATAEGLAHITRATLTLE